MTQYIFDAPIAKCSIVDHHMGLAVRVILDIGRIHYLITINVQGKIAFRLVATLDTKLEEQYMFLDFQTDVFLCRRSIIDLSL